MPRTKKKTKKETQNIIDFLCFEELINQGVNEFQYSTRDLGMLLLAAERETKTISRQMSDRGKLRGENSPLPEILRALLKTRDDWREPEVLEFIKFSLGYCDDINKLRKILAQLKGNDKLKESLRDDIKGPKERIAKKVSQAMKEYRLNATQIQKYTNMIADKIHECGEEVDGREYVILYDGRKIDLRGPTAVNKRSMPLSQMLTRIRAKMGIKVKRGRRKTTP